MTVLALKDEAPKPEENHDKYELVGSGLREVRRLIENIASSQDKSAGVLIGGDNGVGKELVARQIHKLSSSTIRPFVGISCANLTDELKYSELFGHEKGAYTGALASTKGRFEEAADGTLLLDEISTLSKSSQVCLLRVLAERTFYPIGGGKARQVKCRVICASNEDLRQLVANGSFREDLFYRICVAEVYVQPLRMRPGDIPELVDYFLNRHRVKRSFSEEALKVLQEYSWPGNVRQLEHLIRGLNVTLPVEQTIIGLKDFEGKLLRKDKSKNFYLEMPFAEISDAARRNKIEEELRKSMGNIKVTARNCNVTVRTVHRLMKRYNLDKKNFRLKLCT